MKSPHRNEFSMLVYEDILEDLLNCIMRSQLDLLKFYKKNKSIADIPDHEINKHFSWIVRLYPQGINRHFNEPTDNQTPLRVSGLGKKNIPQLTNKITNRLDNRLPPFDPLSEDVEPDILKTFVRDQPTRISSLIKQSFAKSIDATYESHGDQKFLLQSPFTIALQFLTIPEHPGTKAYAQFSIRNYFFSKFNLVPALHEDKPSASSSNQFTIEDIEKSYSTIWTSLRPRYGSKGQDKLSPSGSGKTCGLIRHYLAMKEVFFLIFSSINAAERYLASEESLAPQKKVGKKYPYEYSRSNYLEKLPDVAELINELFGLPIPLRGADTIFRGGLKFSSRQGLVVAIHGGPGTGKTSLALGISASIAPFQIQTLYLTAEETKKDLQNRVGMLVPDEIRRLNFFPKRINESIYFRHFSIPHGNGEAVLEKLENDITKLAKALDDGSSKKQIFESNEGKNGLFKIPKPCQMVVVLDGLHDLFANAEKLEQKEDNPINKIGLLYGLIERFKELRALVVLTTGSEWAGDSTLDYLVDIAMHLSHDSIDEYSSKPDRRLQLLKARHQLCAAGVHGVQISGKKGVRFSPQINYQLDQRSIWKTRLPDKGSIKSVLRRVAIYDIEKITLSDTTIFKNFIDTIHSPDIFDGSHIFINGEGSGGKAALALKIALAPSFTKSAPRPTVNEKILVVSFLYPEEYYRDLFGRLLKLHRYEYQDIDIQNKIMKVFHLYPGYLKPNDLFNKIEWELDSAELYGDPYTCIVIDGIHNVFLQFPALEKYGLFWPQLYSSLRTRPITSITTHTTLAVPNVTTGESMPSVDDYRSEPLRHSLVQKTDFQIEVDPYRPIQDNNTSTNAEDRHFGLFKVKTLAAISQPLPRYHVLWSRECMTLFEDPIVTNKNK